MKRDHQTIINDATQGAEEKKNLLQLLKELFQKLINRDEKFALFAHEMDMVLDEIQTTNMLSLENFNTLMKVVEEQKGVMAEIEEITKNANVLRERYDKVQESLQGAKEEFKSYTAEDCKDNYTINKINITDKQTDESREFLVAYDPSSVNIAGAEQLEVTAIVLDVTENRLLFMTSMEELKDYIDPSSNKEGDESYKKFLNGEISLEEMLGDRTIDKPEDLDKNVEEIMNLLPEMEAFSATLIDKEGMAEKAKLEKLELEKAKNEAYINPFGSINENGHLEMNKNTRIDIEGGKEIDEPEMEM